MSERTFVVNKLGYLAAAFVGAVFLVAAFAKALDPAAFAEQIRVEGLDFVLPAPAVAWFAIVLEAALGFALVLGFRRRTLVPTAMLVVFFVFLTGRAYLKWKNGDLDLEAACGCFGNLVDRTPAEAFWQDLALLVPPLAVAFWLRPRSAKRSGLRPVRVALVGLATLAAGALAWLSPRLPLDELATRLKPGVEIEALCAGSKKPGAEQACLDLVLPELLKGRHVVTIGDLQGKSIEQTVTALDELSSHADPVWLVAETTDEQIQGFFWTWGPSFEVREVPQALLRPLYRALPRSFRVEDGVVVETWSGLPRVEMRGLE